jgi:homocysteine S-methyltransferase
MTRPPLADAIAAGPILLDGAMGSLLYERGILYSQSFDHLSVIRPELVKQVHESYLRAGADLLSTNSFGANRFRLAAHSLEPEVERINRAAVAIAREIVRIDRRRFSRQVRFRRVEGPP